MTKEDFFMLQKYNMYHLCRVQEDGTVTSDIVYEKNPKGAKFLAMWNGIKNKIKYDYILETKLVKD